MAGVIREVGSGLNGKRPMLARILLDRSVAVIVVERRDRLAVSGWSTWRWRWPRTVGA